VHASSYDSSSEEHTSRSSLAISDKSFLEVRDVFVNLINDYNIEFQADATGGFGYASDSPRFFDNMQANACVRRQHFC